MEEGGFEGWAGWTGWKTARRRSCLWRDPARREKKAAWLISRVEIASFYLAMNYELPSVRCDCAREGEDARRQRWWPETRLKHSIKENKKEVSKRIQ